MTVESIVERMRKDGWLLDLSSTHHFADAKYSAAFVRGDLPQCDECDQLMRPIDWDDYAHADTIEEAIRGASEQHFTMEGVE
jgi:hypothetical protein